LNTSERRTPSTISLCGIATKTQSFTIGACGMMLATGMRRLGSSRRSAGIACHSSGRRSELRPSCRRPFAVAVIAAGTWARW
jgi:hypothetical protein